MGVAQPAPNVEVQRRVVNVVRADGTQGPVRETTTTREYAQDRPGTVRGAGAFQGQRNQTVDVSEFGGRLEEVDEGAAPVDRVIVPADSPQGGPMVMESDSVIGGGRAVRSSGQAASQTARRTAGANWMGTDPGKAQNEIMENPVENLQDQEAVSQDQLITRAAQPGPPAPTGEPCSCAFEWEVDERGDITVYASEGIATGFRGAPRYMTWCLICGGERDGQFRPSNAVKYGGLVPEPPKPVSAQTIADQVLARVQATAAPEVDEAGIADAVMGRVSETLASERFLDVLAERIADKLRVPAGV